MAIKPHVMVPRCSRRQEAYKIKQKCKKACCAPEEEHSEKEICILHFCNSKKPTRCAYSNIKLLKVFLDWKPQWCNKWLVGREDMASKVEMKT